MKNLTELEQQVVYHNTRYREGRPEISDQKYDQLLEILKKEQPDSSLLKRGVIEKPGSRKVKLPVKMMSLEKVKTFSKLKKWCSQIDGDILITPKFDGITLLRTSTQCLTRGDGEVGQDCTSHCNYIPSMAEPVKGELIITKENWKSPIFRKYKHPRNVVAGWVNGDHDPNVPYNLMSFIGYEIINSDQSKSSQLKYLRDDSQIYSSPFEVMKKSDLIEMKLDNLFRMWSKCYPMDGLVIEMNSFNDETLTNGNPKYSIAYKPPHYTEVAETIIKKVHFGISRYGVINPIIEFEPVNISGAELSRVNGVNMSYIHDWGLYPGTKIKVIRSGEVIPKIVEVNGINIPFIESFDSPKEYMEKYETAVQLRQSQIEVASGWFDEWNECPFCGTPLIWDENMVNQICPNENCVERKLQSIVEFFRILEVDNIGKGTITILFNNGYTTTKSIINITVDELLQIDGFAEKSANDFVSSMNKLKSNKVPISKHMYASGCFPNLGEKTIQLIFDNCSAGENISKEKLLKVNGLGEKTVDIFLKGLNKWGSLEHDGVEVYRNLPKKQKNGEYKGHVFCFTGCRPTSELRERLENKGAEISDNFTSKVTHLVTKDKNSTSSKTEKAKKLGIHIVPLQELV